MQLYTIIGSKSGRSDIRAHSLARNAGLWTIMLFELTNNDLMGCEKRFVTK